MDSLDPRVQRLPQVPVTSPKPPLDQFGTFEVFVQPKEGKPFQHEGIVHAPNLEMAFVLAKEAFTRRFLCVSLCVADTRHVNTSPVTEGDKSVYELFGQAGEESGSKSGYEVYQLAKRGKQHVHAGRVEASSPREAMLAAKQNFNSGKVIYSVWTIPVEHIHYTQPDHVDLWSTLPEKKFRDASEYKGGDKLKTFLEKDSLKR